MKIIKILILNLCFSLQSVSAFSAEYHVSTIGNDSMGDGSEANPWRTPEYGAKQLLQAGDTLLIHSGTYSVSASNLPSGHTETGRWIALVSPPSNVSGTAISPIVIKSYGDGPVLLDAGTSPQWPAVGTNIGDYLVVDGVSVRGAAILWGTTGSVIKNSNLYGGIDTPLSNDGDNFGCVVRLENCESCTIKNNILHDNQIGITRGNSPLLIEYDSTNILIENNDFYNSVASGIFLKDNPETVTIRNNYIYDNYTSGIWGAAQDNGNNVFIHNNIIRNNNTSNSEADAGITQLVYLNNWQIYNNTFYNNGVSDIRTMYDREISNIQAWNNIHYNDNPFYRVGYPDTGATFATTWTYSDYNQFYGASKSWIDHAKTYTSLSDYSTATGFDSNSVTTDPGFINPGGTSASDYKRSSYANNGRGGAYKSVMGAYITGLELIGFGKRPKSFVLEIQ
jgi:parallel beta-helix repeat protein